MLRFFFCFCAIPKWGWQNYQILCTWAVGGGREYPKRWSKGGFVNSILLDSSASNVWGERCCRREWGATRGDIMSRSCQGAAVRAVFIICARNLRYNQFGILSDDFTRVTNIKLDHQKIGLETDYPFYWCPFSGNKDFLKFTTEELLRQRRQPTSLPSCQTTQTITKTREEQSGGSWPNTGICLS